MPWRAFLLAPIAAPVGYTVAALCLLMWRMVTADESAPTPAAFATVVGGIFAAGTPVAWVAALVVGLPTFLLLRNARRVTHGTVLTAAGAIGVVTSLALAPFLRGELFSIPLPWWLGALLGAACGETFWRLYRRDPRAASSFDG